MSAALRARRHMRMQKYTQTLYVIQTARVASRYVLARKDQRLPLSSTTPAVVYARSSQSSGHMCRSDCPLFTATYAVSSMSSYCKTEARLSFFLGFIHFALGYIRVPLVRFVYLLITI